ncbi:MAG: nitrate ABC transporter permease, partial [Clostridia bacterium]|nr:nitrate ABC transporter permease [Clostridia bacterium]
MRFFAKKDRAPLWKTVSVLAALAVWQTVAVLLNERLILVSPVAVAERLLTIWREDGFFSSVWFSFSRITLGFLLALAVGTVLAILSARFRLVEIMLHPYMVTVKTVPVVSFIVLAYVWLSSGAISVFICSLIVLPTVYTGLLAGLRSVDKKMLEMADV